MCVELKLPRAAARTVVLQRLRGAGSQRFVGRQHGVAHIDVAAGSVQVGIPGKGLAAGEVDGAGRDAQVAARDILSVQGRFAVRVDVDMSVAAQRAVRQQAGANDGVGAGLNTASGPGGREYDVVLCGNHAGVVDIALRRRRTERDTQRPEAWIAELLAGRDRTVAGPTAPPDGLVFVSPLYPAEWRLPTEVTLPAPMG